jgi:hypothetical protein
MLVNANQVIIAIQNLEPKPKIKVGKRGIKYAKKWNNNEMSKPRNK